MIKKVDYREACKWWSDLTEIWTPLGWHEHMFRFNVLWNGTVLAEPHRNRRTTGYAGQGLLLGFAPFHISFYAERDHPYLTRDDGQVKQGWLENDAPVLWTEWSRDGVLIRQYAFAHLAGGSNTRSGVEPLYLWIRLEIVDVCEALPLEKWQGVSLLFHNNHASCCMSKRNNIKFEPKGPFVYPRPLRPALGGKDPHRPLIVDDREHVRLGVVRGTRGVTAEFFDPDSAEDRPCHRLYLSFPTHVGEKADLLLPMVPAPMDEYRKEASLGYDRALRQSGAFWRRILATPTRVVVPEKDVEDSLRKSIRFSHMLCERNPATGRVCKITGSWAYVDLWATPAATDIIMVMDMMGHHNSARRLLDIFQAEQGTVTPPGDAFTRHPGYLSTPAAYKAIDWLSDNGALLWAICMHYLLSGDKDYLASFIETIIKSCEWIKDARAIRGHGGYEGVLPPAAATDNRTIIQSVWSIGWNFLGLQAAVRVLRQAGHPRAAEFAAEAKDYKQRFIEALRHKCATMPVWRDARGRERRFVPSALMGDKSYESRHAFYLDTGPLFMVFAGLLPANDPLMRDALAWFREGPQKRFYRPDSNCWQVPVLEHEISSCEPVYSWNIFHSWQLGDKTAFLTGLYSSLAGALSRQTRIACETRGGITGTVFCTAFYMARLAVIDEQIKPGELHLLRLMPDAWLTPGAVCEFVEMPTEFGPVTLTTKVTRQRRLDIRFSDRFRSCPSKVVLHVPAGITGITLNGKPLAKGRKQIVLDQGCKMRG